ncbi:hypothetical protein [uncultured Sunxiuqinia sp.]|uniref:hypothetical protein n=1 Tax=uncultured Sunxiuqinia sp. TaxID=1573825 RepID=UPI0030DDA4C3|tara:strand:- start:433 stop:606 length:174 start_codon:yes stop_codon:yes gene_type:complete
MIEILKVSIHEKDGVKMVGIKYAKDGVCMPFILLPYNELSDGLGDVRLKQKVLDYLN